VLGLMLPGLPAQFIAAIRVKPGQSFRLPHVPPGEYLLVASTRKNERAVQPVTVRDRPVKGLSITMPVPVPIRIRAEVEQAPTDNESPTSAPRLPAANLAISCESEKLQMYGLTGKFTDEKGALDIVATAPGETYSLRFPSLPKDAYVASIAQGDRDLNGTAPFIVASPDEVRILLKKDGGTIRGLLDRTDGSVKRAFIVLAPTSSGARYLYRKVISDERGEFTIPAIAPGEYNLFAFKHDDDDILDPAFLSRFASKAIHLAIQPKEERPVSVRVIDPPGERE